LAVVAELAFAVHNESWLHTMAREKYMKEKVEKSTIADESGTIDHVTERNELLEPVAEGHSKDFQGISIPAVLGRLTVHEQAGHDYSYPYAYFNTTLRSPVFSSQSLQTRQVNGHASLQAR
jgi:hypothetical protein